MHQICFLGGGEDFFLCAQVMREKRIIKLESGYVGTLQSTLKTGFDTWNFKADMVTLEEFSCIFERV